MYLAPIWLISPRVMKPEEQMVLKNVSEKLHGSIEELRALMRDGRSDRSLEQILALLSLVQEDVERAACRRAA